MDFERSFIQIRPEQIPDDVFTLVGSIFPVVAVGTPGRCNAMVASGGGMGILFRKPAVWCIFPSNRYTLGLIQISAAPVEDIYSEEAKAYLAEAYADPGEKRQYVFGGITRVWTKYYSELT